MDELNWQLGLYVAVGVNNPKKYPKKPQLGNEKSKSMGMTTDEQVSAFIKAKFEGR